MVELIWVTRNILADLHHPTIVSISQVMHGRDLRNLPMLYQAVPELKVLVG